MPVNRRVRSRTLHLRLAIGRHAKRPARLNQQTIISHRHPTQTPPNGWALLQKGLPLRFQPRQAARPEERPHRQRPRVLADVL
jgi:hypothetical protein